MRIEIEPHKAKNMITKREVCFKQYLIKVDDKIVGLVGWAPGSKIIFTSPIGPFEQDIIRSEVEKKLDRRAELVECPDVSEELLNQEEEHHNEFDEKDLT